MKLNEMVKLLLQQTYQYGIGEIIGGSQREDDFDKLKNRLKELNLREDDYWWYLDLRRYGSCNMQDLAWVLKE